MPCLNNLERQTFSNRIMMPLLELYEYRGKDYYFDNTLHQASDKIIKQTIERDSFYFSLFMNLDINKNRQKLILKKDSEARNKQEQMLKNIKYIFTTLALKGEDFELSTNEFLQTAKKLYKDCEEIGYETYLTEVKVNLLTEKKRESKRNDIEELLKTYIKLLKTKEYELTNLIINFYIDFINIKPFRIGNEYLGLIFLYALLLKEKFRLFKFSSFFEVLYENKERFENAVKKANYDWESNYSKVEDLHEELINLMLICYHKIDKLAKDTNFDKNVSKSNNIENTIQKLPEVFTKDDIRERHPYVSLSTIDRTLKRLKEEGKIRPNGCGRSASWIKLVTIEKFEPHFHKQMSLFDIIMESNEGDE